MSASSAKARASNRLATAGGVGPDLSEQRCGGPTEQEAAHAEARGGRAGFQEREAEFVVQHRRQERQAAHADNRLGISRC